MKKIYLLSFSILIASLYIESTQVRADNAAKTRIEADEKAGVIRFIVDGEERAVLDKGGLRVNGGIEYTGALTDTNVWPGSEAADAK